jgi:hypothetical protein
MNKYCQVRQIADQQLPGVPQEIGCEVIDRRRRSPILLQSLVPREPAHYRHTNAKKATFPVALAFLQHIAQ